MGVASRGRTKLRWQPFFKTFPASEQYQPRTWLHWGHDHERFSISCLICTSCQKVALRGQPSVLLMMLPFCYIPTSLRRSSVWQRERTERDRDQVGHFRAARVRRTKNKSSFVSLVDDRATWHIVCFSIPDLSEVLGISDTRSGSDGQARSWQGLICSNHPCFRNTLINTSSSLRLLLIDLFFFFFFFLSRNEKQKYVKVESDKVRVPYTVFPRFPWRHGALPSVIYLLHCHTGIC